MHWTSNDVSAAAAAATGLCTATWIVWRKAIRPVLKFVSEFRDDWRGTPARPGVRARPGVMERLENIESQVKPNGGQSMHDAVSRIEQQLASPATPPAIHIHPPAPGD